MTYATITAKELKARLEEQRQREEMKSLVMEMDSEQVKLRLQVIEKLSTMPPERAREIIEKAREQ